MEYERDVQKFNQTRAGIDAGALIMIVRIPLGHVLLEEREIRTRWGSQVTVEDVFEDPPVDVASAHDPQ